MVVALEGAIGETAVHLTSQTRELVVDQLVGEVVRLRRNTDGHLIPSGELRHGHEVGDRLANAGTGLDHAVRGGGERIAHFDGHLHLL